MKGFVAILVLIVSMGAARADVMRCDNRETTLECATQAVLNHEPVKEFFAEFRAQPSGQLILVPYAGMGDGFEAWYTYVAVLPIRSEMIFRQSMVLRVDMTLLFDEQGNGVREHIVNGVSIKDL